MSLLLLAPRNHTMSFLHHTMSSHAHIQYFNCMTPGSQRVIKIVRESMKEVCLQLRWHKSINPSPAVLQMWESGSCSDSGYNHRSSRKFTHVFTYEMTAQTPAPAEMEKWLRTWVRFFPSFWLRLRIRVRKKNPGSCWSWIRLSGSVPTSGAD